MNGSPYHPECITCIGCDKNINGQKIFLTEDGSMMCKACAQGEPESPHGTGGAAQSPPSRQGTKDDAPQQSLGKESTTKRSAPAPAPAPKQSLKEIEKGLDSSTGLVTMGGAATAISTNPNSIANPIPNPDLSLSLSMMGGELTTVKRAVPATGAAVEHTGKELPAALEGDLAKVARETAADRIEKQIWTNELLVGKTISEVRFNRNGFCQCDIHGEFKHTRLKIGLKEGSYRIKNGLINVSWKDLKYTHNNWTGGKAIKQEKIRPIEHQKIPLPDPAHHGLGMQP